MSLRQRLNAWWLPRLPRTDNWVLGQRNVYIVPTPAGWAFTAMLGVNLLATINYQLNLGYMLIFLLVGIGIVSIYVTHQNLRGVSLHMRPPSPGFAKEAATVDVVISAGSRERHDLWVEFQTGDRTVAHTDVMAGGQTTLSLRFVPPHRGAHDLPPIRVETRFPFGLFRAWTIWLPQSQALAWPSLEHPVAPWPQQVESTQGGNLRLRREGDEWDGVRAWQRGDPMRRIVWKKVARTGELVSRDTTTVVDREVWFDWANTQGLDKEARLSRLATWVQAATQQGLAHGVRLPSLHIEPNLGPAHRVKALNALANFD